MKTQEFEFKGFVGNGFAFLFLNLILTALSVASFFFGDVLGAMAYILGVVGLVLTFFIWAGVKQLEPNEARAVSCNFAAPFFNSNFTRNIGSKVTFTPA